MKSTVLTMKNGESGDVSNLLELALQNQGYNHEQIIHYTFLVENALIDWKERLPSDAELSFSRKDTSQDFRFVWTLPGEKCDPFRVEGVDGEKLSVMVDKLMSGVGSELRYRYRRGENIIILSLPKKNISERIFRKNLLILMIPILIQQLLQRLAQNANAFLLGFMDASSMSAVSIVAKFVQIHSNLLLGITIASTALLAQYWGVRDREKSRKVAAAAGRFAIAGSLLLAFCALVFPETIMKFYTDIPVLIRQGSLYMRLMGINFLLIPFYEIPYCLMRTSGKIKECAIFTMTGCAVNLLCNGVFIFGLLGCPRMGITGAGLSVIISSAVQVILLAVYSIRHPYVRMHILKGCKPGDPVSKQFRHEAWPAIAQYLIWIVGMNIVTSVFGHMDAALIDANSAISIVFNIIVYTAYTAIGQGAAILMGSLLGKGKLEEAKTRSKQLLRIGTRYSLGVAVLLVVGAFLLRYLPMDLNDEAIAYTNPLMIFFGLNTFFCGMNAILGNGALHAGGDTRGVLIADVINIWGILVPVSLLKLYVFPQMPVLLVMAILKSDEVLSFPVKFARYRTWKWLKKLT